MTHIKRPITTPPRTGLTREDLWEGQDRGLIKCWEIGRERAVKFPELAQRCLAGELPVLGWKGGVSRSLKKAKNSAASNTSPNGRACAVKTWTST